MRSVLGDIRDLDLLASVYAEHRPEVIFHLAAQPLVRHSYDDPLTTYSTNVMGTVHVMEAARKAGGVRAMVLVTSDKCYENKEWERPYKEIDSLGGYDPYSNSKACAELAISAYRNSFFKAADYEKHGVALASVRAGNVIGGGDWAADRLVPDMMRAFMEMRAVHLRNPRAIRPWQYVLEPLRGYLAVAESLLEKGAAYAEAWNFGPRPSDARPVEWMVRELAGIWGGEARWEFDHAAHPHEAKTLKLDCAKAEVRLGWRPALDLRQAMSLTCAWYKQREQGADMHAFTSQQISEYEEMVAAIQVCECSGVRREC
jgi:CDP-glucose 4,6-dehydratase